MTFEWFRALPRWQRGLLWAALAAFLLLVWPTPFHYYQEGGSSLRRNRITGTVQEFSDGHWGRR